MATATRFAAVDIENSYAEDEHTVVLKLFNYDNCLLPYLTGEYGQILNKKYVEEVGEDEAIGQHPIGTGPYVFSEWDVGTSITLVKNETYWGDPSNQNFDSIKYMFFSDDNIRALELEQGNLDIALLNTNESIGRISGMGEQGLAVSSVPLTKVGYFCMATIIRDTFQDVNKQLAIAHALDMDAIVSTIAGETAIAATSLFPSGSLGYADHSYEYDPELAKEYLEKAGCPNGFEFTIEVANNQQMNLELAEAMQAYLGQVGITMNIEPMDFGTQFGNMLAGTQLCSILVGTCNGDPSMGLTAFAPGSEPALPRIMTRNLCVCWMHAVTNAIQRSGLIIWRSCRPICMIWHMPSLSMKQCTPWDISLMSKGSKELIFRVSLAFTQPV